MLRLSIIFGLLASIIWRTTPTSCRHTAQHNHQHAYQPHHQNVNQILAANLVNYMDETARPCENFYQFACGRWYQQHIDQLEFGDTIGYLDFELNRKLEHLLKRVVLNTTAAMPEFADVQLWEDDDSNATNTILQKLSTYYKSCKKVKPYNLKKYLQLIQPGFESYWLVLIRNGGKNWSADKFNWVEAIAKLRLYGLNGVLLREEVLPRWDESSSYSIYLDKPNLGDTEPMGEGAMIELLMDIGQTKRMANSIAREVNAFERLLHKLHEIEDEEGPKEMQLGFLCEYMPQIDWVCYLKQLKGSSTNMESTVIIQNISFMRALARLLNGVPKETVCNYIMLKFLQFLKEQGPADISKQECIASMRRAMPLAASYIVGKYFYKNATTNDAVVQQVFNRLKQKFRQTLSDNRLQLQQPIVDSLLQKIQTMRLQIGNSPRNITPEYFSEYYERVELDAHNFYINQLSLLRFMVEKLHENLEPTVSSNFSTSDNETFVLYDWIGSSSSPFYVKPRNTVIIPYGFLHMPNYHAHMKNIFKYSSLGFTLAHELLHGFDSNGIDYDSAGNLMGPSEEIAANQRFMHGLRCMQSELATGSRSLNEKLADYEGFRLVYETYFSGNSSKKDILTTLKLPSKYNRKQLFFISFAQLFCGKVHHRKGRHSAYLEHALDELRVLQTLANFEEFSKEFSCERRAKMQSKNRCRLW